MFDHFAKGSKTRTSSATLNEGAEAHRQVYSTLKASGKSIIFSRQDGNNLCYVKINVLFK